MIARSHRGRGVSWPLFLLCLALGSWVYWALAKDEDAGAPAGIAGTEAVTGAEPADGVGFTLPALEDMEETIERPLFVSSRRPIEDVAPVVEAPVETAADAPAALRGVIISESERSALLQVRRQAEAVWVAEGSSVGGWAVTEILADRVTLRRGDETRTLLLKDETSKARPTRTTRRATSQQTPPAVQTTTAPQTEDSEPKAQ